MTITHPEVTASGHETFYSPAQVCERWPGMTLARLKAMRFKGQGPKFVKLSGRTIVYSEAALTEYEQGQERTITEKRAS